MMMLCGWLIKIENIRLFFLVHTIMFYSHCRTLAQHAVEIPAVKELRKKTVPVKFMGALNPWFLTLCLCFPSFLPVPPPWPCFSLICMKWINRLRAGGCLGPTVLGGIDCDDEVDPHFVLKAYANLSSPLRNCHQKTNLFPCVLTEDEQLHLQKQFGRA